MLCIGLGRHNRLFCNDAACFIDPVERSTYLGHFTSLDYCRVVHNFCAALENVGEAIHDLEEGRCREWDADRKIERNIKLINAFCPVINSSWLDSGDVKCESSASFFLVAS